MNCLHTLKSQSSVLLGFIACQLLGIVPMSCLHLYNIAKQQVVGLRAVRIN